MQISPFKKLNLLLSLIVVGICGIANAVPGDYDADGTSDLSVALVNRTAKTTAWLTRPTNGSAALFWTWGLPGDALVSGRFYPNDPKYYPGIVYVRSASFPLEWYIKTATGTDAFLKFGLPGDTVPNQGDWDGDGITDLAVVRNVGGQLKWYVSLTGSGGAILEYAFGLNGDKVGVSDIDGDGRVELIALRSGFQWYIGNTRSGSVTAPQQWGLNGDINLLPTDIDGDSLADFVITRRTGTFQLAYIKYGNGTTQNVTLGFDSSIPQMGSFVSSLPTFAWSQRDTGWTAIRNLDGTPNVFRLGIAANAIIRADGTVVQPSEDGRFGGTSGGTTPPDSGSGGSASCTTTYGSGWLLKPAAQDTGGSRLGKPLILFSRNYPSSSCLNVIATDGTVLGKYGIFSSNRFYSGYGCGSGFSASQFASLAVNATGSKNIYIQDPSSGACYGPGPADGRTDKR